ncbi:MAG: trimethylamine methyltransferase family protein, partial [Anaerolineae bacterium]|nr:trimethylamine methyltransferase family protein [Anaerolineae bacterium]
MSDRESRSRRREERRSSRRGSSQPGDRAVKSLVTHLPPSEVLHEEGVEMIHQASMRLLKETGMLIIDYPPALETFRQNGAKVEGEMVWIDEETLLHFVKQAPAAFGQLARNPANTLTIGGR